MIQQWLCRSFACFTSIYSSYWSKLLYCSPVEELSDSLTSDSNIFQRFQLFIYENFIHTAAEEASVSTPMTNTGSAISTPTRRFFNTALKASGSGKGFGVSNLATGKRHPIQIIYESLANVPTSPSPLLSHTLEYPLQDSNLTACLDAMNQIQLADLGFDEEDINGIDESVCATIALTKQFNVAVFMIPKGHSLPLHDHPSMAVFSKVIYGELEMKSYSLLRNSNGEGIVGDKSPVEVVQAVPSNPSLISDAGNELMRNDAGAIAAKLTCSVTKSSKDPAWFLTPKMNNVHEFKAATNCVVLDCLLPPYDEPERPCNFYKATPFSASNNADSNTNSGSSSSNTVANNQINSMTSSQSQTQMQQSKWWLLPIPEDSHSLPHTIEYPGIRPIKKAKGFSSNSSSRWDQYFS